MMRIFAWIAMSVNLHLGSSAKGILTGQPSTHHIQKHALYLATPVTMCVLMERNTTGLIYDYNRVQAAIDMALEYVNEFIVEPYHYIQMLYADIGQTCPGSGAITYAAAYALKYWETGINCDVYLGPGCGYAADPVDDLARAWDKPLIGLPAASLGFLADFRDYTCASRLSIAFPGTKKAILKFLAYFNYSSPVFIKDLESEFYTEMYDMIKASLERDGVINSLGITFAEFGDDHGARYKRADLDKLLQKVGSSSRALVIMADAKGTRMFMLVARALGMTNGDYVFLAVNLYDSQIWGSFDWKIGANDDADVLEAYRALVLLQLEDPPYTTYLSTFWREVMARSEAIFGYTFSAYDVDHVDPVVVHAYEAVLYYATFIAQIAASPELGLDFRSGLNFTNFAANSSFESPITGTIYMDDSSDREFTYLILTLTPTRKKHEPVLRFPTTNQNVSQLGPLEFVGRNSFPPNNYQCGFLNSNPACQPPPTGMSIANLSELAIGVVVLLCALIAASTFAIVKRAQRNLPDSYWWRIMSVYLVSDRTAPKSGRSMAQTKSLAHSNGKMDKEISMVGVKPGMTDTATFAGQSVSILECPRPKTRVTHLLPLEAAIVRKFAHVNVQSFIGVAVSEDNYCEYFVMELCQRGSLRTLLEDQSLRLDWEFKNSLIKDLTNGLAYLLSTELLSHGFLTDEACRIDSRFVVKISGAGFASLRSEADMQPLVSDHETRDYRLLLWRAPELLRRTMPPFGTPKGDSYSYGILLQQIILRTDPFQLGEANKKVTKFQDEQMSIRDILFEVKRGSAPPLRPPVPVSACSTALHEIMDTCWEENPSVRPTLAKIKPIIMRSFGKSEKNLVSHLFKRMEQYASELESKVNEKMKQFMEEKERSAALLQHLLPASIGEALSKGIHVVPEIYDNTTVYFGDVPAYAEAVEDSSPIETVDLLNKLYSCCDTVLATYDVFKVEVANDAYLVVSGLPVRNGNLHAEQIASMALALKENIAEMKTTLERAKNFRLRAGIHSGPCVAGVIGTKMPRYCLFGDTVNTASRMESHGEARGMVSIKGKGMMSTFWLIEKG